ncbi:MAG: sulfatase-like hydrolase/transferase [Planctomycetota bacterium]|jgi:arylsulfatase A-like enzyme
MKPPNILIVMSDHQRADTVLEEHPALTPNVTRLAAEGVTFTSAFCPSPHCCPSRATFMSGLYPSGHGVWNNVLNAQALSTGLKPGVRLWSEDLAAAGYRMHFAGKWHVSAEESPADRGWTEHDPSAVKPYAHGRGWTLFEEFASNPDPAARGEGEILVPGWRADGRYRLYGTRDGTPHDERVRDHAVRLIRECSGGDSPWCIYAGFTGPHDPYFVPQKYLATHRLEDVPLPANYSDEMTDKPRVYGRMRRARFGQLSEREVREGIRHFWAYCSYLDDLFGEILAALEESGEAEDTLVLYCSDHGDYCGEHGLFCKGIPCFRGAYNVPAVVRWPRGLASPGRRVDEFVSLADFAPTFLGLAGVEADREFTGASLAPFLRDEEPKSWRDAVFTQCNGVELYFTQRSVTTREHKYVYNGFDDDELYDLVRDPGETVNLAADPACAEVKRRLCGRIWDFARRAGDAPGSPYITVGLAPYGPAEGFRRS